MTGIAVSDWLYLTVISVAFYCALGKRRNELKRTGSGTRTVLKNYSPEFHDKNMYMCLALANVFYALWSTDGSTAELYGGKHMVFTVPIVLLITMKYSMDVEGDSDGGSGGGASPRQSSALSYRALSCCNVCYTLYCLRSE